ncbi:MAG: hypothetical protein Q9209_007730 [Squamulea sp. 1 TL-2023]
MPSYTSFGPACDKCNRLDTSNMTWEDGMKNFFSTYFASSRMGPLGYILNNPYSPLYVERALPSHNWRDAFEDLLAIDLTGKMINTEDRAAEDVVAARNRYDDASQAIQLLNYTIQKNEELKKFALESRNVAVDNRDDGAVARIDNAILPELKALRENHISEGIKCKEEYDKDMAATATSLKTRGQWITSLINSGALPGWRWTVRNSVDGPTVYIRRKHAPPELDAAVAMSELELNEHFEKGQPYNFDSPQPLPEEKLQMLVKNPPPAPDPAIGGSLLRKFWPSPSSILCQDVETEPVQLANGSPGVKVIIQNRLLNGKVATKEIVRQPGKVLEEIESARRSMRYVRDFTRSGGNPDSVGQSDLVLYS